MGGPILPSILKLTPRPLAVSASPSGLDRLVEGLASQVLGADDPIRLISADEIAFRGEVFDSIAGILRIINPGDQFEVADRLADSQIQLVAIDQPGKGSIPVLPLVDDCQQVIVLGKENAAELGGPIEQAVVVPGRGSIVLAGQDVDPPPTEPYGDRDIHMMIHVELDTHGSRPRSRSLRRPGDSPAPARSRVARSCRFAMSRSISCLWSK